jgi:hypothetical protein
LSSCAADTSTAQRYADRDYTPNKGGEVDFRTSSP